MFDIIDEAHLHLAHAKGSCTMYNFIGKVWHGITEKVIKVYRDLCPVCLKQTKPSKAESLGQLQIMISDTVGSRAQMYLVDIHRRQVSNYKWILRYVDHHSGYSHIACLRNKKAKTVGLELIQILTAAEIPELLQSDNGGEFSGECVR